MKRPYRIREDIREFHENFVEEQFALCELSDTEDFDYRQKIRNMFRYQARGHCFELPPVCAHWGKRCFSCPHVNCRENEMYDREASYNSETDNYEFDPDINRFARLADTLFDLADFDSDTGTAQFGTAPFGTTQSGAERANAAPPNIDPGRSLNSLLASIAGY